MRGACCVALLGALVTANCVGPNFLAGEPNDYCGYAGNPHPPTSIQGPSGVAVGRGTITLTACFPGDREDLAAVAAVQWTSLTPERASVSPMTGRQTELTGLSFGIAKVRAIIKGVSVEREIGVCTNEGVCPP